MRGGRIFAGLAIGLAVLAPQGVAADPPVRSGTYYMSETLKALQGDDVANPGMLWVSEGGAQPPEELTSRFTTVEGPVEFFGDFRGRRLHTFQVWRLRTRKP